MYIKARLLLGHALTAVRKPKSKTYALPRTVMDCGRIGTVQCVKSGPLPRTASFPRLFGYQPMNSACSWLPRRTLVIFVVHYRKAEEAPCRCRILFMPSTSKPTGWRVQRCSGGGDTVGKNVRTLPQNRRRYSIRLRRIEVASDRVGWVLGSCRRQSDMPCVDETGYCCRIERTVKRALRWSGARTGRKPRWLQRF